MCGIFGELNNHPLKLSSDKSHPLVALMARRGPDDEGYWSDGQYCAFGFRRLAILDLSPTGHQPMLTADGRYAIVYNGELYNFQDLRQDLARRGVQFHSTGDTEVVLYALATWGKDALRRFNGMFALAFYDSVEKRLLLARDHAGIKPLYYLHTPEGVVFASQYNQLMAHPWGRDLEVSREALLLYLHLGYVPAPAALLRNTFMLEPGTYLEVQPGKAPQQGVYFAFPQFCEPTLSGEVAYEAVDAAITAAVRRQMISDVPLGMFLSGGIDSPLVAAKMQAATNNSVRAFTISTNGHHTDESDDAIDYARTLGIQHTIEDITPEEALTLLDDVAQACSEPHGDYSIFPTMLVSRAARRHVTVALSGDGGDELFWGYNTRFGRVIQAASLFQYPRWLRKVFQLPKIALGTAADNHYSISGFPTIGNWYYGKHDRFHAPLLNQLLPDLETKVTQPPLPPLFTYAGWDRQQTAQWLRWNEFVGHLSMVLLKVDRASMYYSLEVRVPLLDREVVEVATQVDWQSCLDLTDETGKIPLRKSLARHIKRQTQDKRGFDVPMTAWLKSALRPMLEELLLNRQDILGIPIKTNVMRTFIADHATARADYTLSLWNIFALALWEAKHYRKARALVDH